MHGLSPFVQVKDREPERKHIPDSWIFEAALEIKPRPGRHCVLVKDQRFKQALEHAGFEVFAEISELDQVIEKATIIVPIRSAEPEGGAKAVAAADVPISSPSALERLRAEAFKDLAGR